MSSEDIIEWAEQELDASTSAKITSSVRIYDNDSFLKGGKKKNKTIHKK